MKICRDRVIISSGFQEKGGCPLIRACSVITSNTVFDVFYGITLSRNGLKKCTKSSDDLHNKCPHVWAMEPLGFTYISYAE